MSTGKRNKTVLTLAAVAMVVLAIGQVQAEPIDVPNGDFQLYKPGTDYTVTATLSGAYAVGVGDNVALSGGGNANYSDGTSGGSVDVPSWIPVTGAADGQFLSNGVDGSAGLNGFGAWAKTGNRIQSADSLGDLKAGRIYTLSSVISGPIIGDPDCIFVLDLLTDGVALTPSSSVTPTTGTSPGGDWQVISRTYETTTVDDFGKPVTIVVGTGPSPDATVAGRVVFDNITLDVENPMNPFPDYGDAIYLGNVELSWTNWPAADSNDVDVWVDVWFGTEPNELSPNYDMTLVVDATTLEGKNATSVIVDASGDPETYYWEVNSYINGEGTINDANMLKWVTWTFTTTPDLPIESVDAGEDMVTWSGQAVLLDATVVDDGVSPLTYAWSADPADGVVFSDAGAEDPSVTITKPVWVEVTVPNAGFEERLTYDEDFTPNAPGEHNSWDKFNQADQESWRHFEVDNNGGPLRIWNPGDPAVATDLTTQGIADVGFGGNAAEGDIVVVVRSRYNDNEFHDPPQVRDFEAAVQLLDEEFDPGTSYKLTAKVGRMPEGEANGGSINYLWDDGGADPNFAGPIPAWNGYAVQLVVGGTTADSGGEYSRRVIGGTVIAQDWNTSAVPMNTFVTVSVEYTPDPLLADLAGQPLQIRLCALEDPADHSTTSWAAFDDVKLEASVTTYTLTLGVNDEYNTTPVEDTLTIDVYDNPCHAAIFGMSLGADNPLDYNKDCIANLVDAAVMAAKWAVDNSLTEPIAK